LALESTASGLEILLDLDIHRPDIVIHDCVQHCATLLDASIPDDFNTLWRRNVKNPRLMFGKFGIFDNSIIIGALEIFCSIRISFLGNMVSVHY